TCRCLSAHDMSRQAVEGHVRLVVGTDTGVAVSDLSFSGNATVMVATEVTKDATSGSRDIGALSALSADPGPVTDDALADHLDEAFDRTGGRAGRPHRPTTPTGTSGPPRYA